MRVLLRQTKTSVYYAGPDQWATDAKQARDFEEVDRAIQVQRQERLANVEIVLRFDDPFCDAVLSLPTPA
jgi:hypothetical protein